MSSIKAASVSRYLGKMGLTRAEWTPSAQVRGWGHQTGGYKCEDTYDFNHRPTVRVSWLPGDELRRETPAWIRGFILERVNGMKIVLDERYVVQLEVPDATFGGDPYLMVTSKDEEGDNESGDSSD